MRCGTTRRSFLAGIGLPLVAPAVQTARSLRPNVLWLMTDEQRPDSLACYGSRWAHSPHLDRLAAEGLLFESAYVPAPVCVPCRSGLLTGNYGSSTGVLHNQQRLSPDARFLTWLFEDAGYQTASFGKKHYFHAGRQAFQQEGGRPTEGIVEPEHYGEGYDAARHDVLQYPDLPSKGPRRRWILAGRFPSARDQSAEARNVELCTEWLSRHNPERPFLLRLSLNAPHTPVVAPPEFLRQIDPDKIDLPFPKESDLAGTPPRERFCLRDFQGSLVFSEEQIRKARHYYYARAAFADAEIGRLLGWMRQRGLLDNTIVVFTSDHGTHLGDHGLFQKQTFYEQVATVPFLIWWRGLAGRGVRLRTPVNTISMLSTALGLAGLHLPWPVEADSLASEVSRGAEPESRPVFSEIQFGYQGCRDDHRQVMVRHGRYKLSLFLDPLEPGRFSENPEGALYDLDRDPAETTNRFEDRSFRDVVERLRRAITRWDRSRLAHKRTPHEKV